ncbi:MAG: glycosyltransferase family 2 protein [Bacteroidales bacterium]|nr:glycosyltransferase family 2 protein [Bacteroidales bacterium]MBR4326700.1 glycosyltransferase family 2 protein [Bacteroidales bacterium]
MNSITEQPLLTIAIPTYNGSKTICNMMSLLLEQYDSRVEILVSDNCSTDITPEIIENYRKKYPFIRYIRNDSNIGADANYLQCMRMATGKFIHLLSDDDIMCEGALSKVLDFLDKNKDVTLVYLYTKGFRGRYVNIGSCSTATKQPSNDICTTDKKVFMDYAGYYWGFMTSFVIAKCKFDKIHNPEQYYGTYWLQSYIHILCCADKDDKVGVISYPCIGAGIYVNVNNFDCSLVDGTNYRAMLDFAINEGGFDKQQLEKLFKWRIIFLGRHAIIKEKAAGTKKTSKIGLFKHTWKYPTAWVKLYPFFLIPKFICRIAMNHYRSRRQMDMDVTVNREGDQKS